MRHDDETLLKNAVEAIQAAELSDAQVASSAARVAGRLGIDNMNYAAANAIEGCTDIQHSLPSFRAGTLSSARSLLIEAHLRDCSACRRYARGASGEAVLDWSAPGAARSFVWRPRQFGWTLASALALLICALFVYNAYWRVPPGVRAEVQSIEGSAYRISDAGNHRLSPGDVLNDGEQLRTSGGAHAVLRLRDGSTVEVNERSVVGVGARGRNMTVTLDNGAVIVQAAKRDFGHLYLKTPDCRVAVTGTVFSVNAGIKGSRVAVLEGTVHVMHAGLDTLVQAGDQMATSGNLGPAPVEEQITWSHDRDKYLPLLAQFSLLRHRIGQIPFPQPRYSSDLLDRVPASTLLYISVPNLGDFLSQANDIFRDQLKQSPALQQWWGHGQDRNTADLDTLVAKLHQASQYLGDEIVIAGVKQPNDPGIAILADVQKGGLDDFLKLQFPSSDSAAGLTVFNESSLASATLASRTQPGGFALVRDREVVFANSVLTLKQMDAQLNAGPSGFAAGEFGQQIAAAYGRGAGVILAADLHQMMESKAGWPHAEFHGGQAIEKSGVEGVRYLIAEHREVNGEPENRVNLQFAGARQGIASWMATPAPIGSLDFVSPNAAIAVAVLSKDPKAIADDILAMTASRDGDQGNGLKDAEEKLHIDFREDLAANLGGDFLLSLDGPVLPTPSWKAVIEVRDSDRLQQALERMTESIRNLAQGPQAHSIAIESEEAGGRRFYAIRDLTTSNTVAYYTYAEGFMIVAPSRALLVEALRTRESGDSLARSEAFKALFPKDGNENYSAIAYQNLTPVLTPLLSEFSGEQADALRQLAADARPTAICARAEENRIEAASDSHLFGFDFLTLQTLLKSGNKQARTSVNE
jgi:hypothetical protein